MTLHYKDWDLDDWYTARDLANQLREALTQLEQVPEVLRLADKGWLSSEVQEAWNAISDVAKSLWQDETKDCSAEPVDPVNDDLVVTPPDPSRISIMQEIVRRRRAGDDRPLHNILADVRHQFGL